MKPTRILGIGLLIWIIGVHLYALSFYVPLIENAALQANIWLSMIVLPVVWFGAKLYYQKRNTPHGFWVGLLFFFISAILDALITVPLTVLPYGGTYADFFIDFGFWFIGLEFMVVTVLYWYMNIHLKEKYKHTTTP